ncbi:hypothetical protein ANAPRD1_00736 [Anaplasma phagocytophilum]|nr:hypothetical protein ANAPRD1_00736 [Anaplasma phagocytophilum]SCV65043.1 hypothetical protein ANAPH1_00728 [Anaplasma phagocytophilum]
MGCLFVGASTSQRSCAVEHLRQVISVLETAFVK